MATQVQIRRGTTAGHSSFTGAVAELTFDTDLKTIRAHDGSTAGGIVLARASDINTAVSNLIDSAPGALNTLNELAAAINNDNNFAATVVTQLNTKAAVSSLTTANVTEISNLYFTQGRARESISASGSINYSNTSGIISFTQGNTDTIVEGVSNFYFTEARVTSSVSGNLALKANLTDKLNVFAATTSAELAELITDETGSGNLVFNASPTFTGNVSVAELSASGNVTSPFFYSQSDINLKKNIEPLTNPLSTVLELEGVKFNWIHNDQPSIGLIAQDVENILPFAVGQTPDGYKTVQYNSIIALLIEAVKEQQVQIDSLKQRIETLNG